MKRTCTSKYGPWALVTGAARGLGAEFARQLAAAGLDLVLVDRLTAELESQAEELERTHGITTRPVVCDLARPDFLDVVTSATPARQVGLLVCNAAHAPITPFFDQELEDKLRTLDVNARATLCLVDHYGRSMLERGRGGMLLLSSFSAFQGTPLVATYAATKAFNRILAESLWAELRGSGVDVLAVSPGLTDTHGYRESQPDRRSITSRLVLSESQVVREALCALGRSSGLVPGLSNRLSGLLLHRFAPRDLAIRLFSQGIRRLYPNR